MFINDEYIIEHLKKKWNWYFRSSFFYGLEFINEVPRDIYKDFMTFLKDNFKQDILFDYLYSEYEKYIFKKYKETEKQYLSKSDFEAHLLDVDLKTYTFMDDNYERNKCVYFDNNSK